MELYYKILSAMESSGIDCGSYVELAKHITQELLKEELVKKQQEANYILLQLQKCNYVTEE